MGLHLNLNGPMFTSVLEKQKLRNFSVLVCFLQMYLTAIIQKNLLRREEKKEKKVKITFLYYRKQTNKQTKT